jgi:hypothetical protein
VSNGVSNAPGIPDGQAKPVGNHNPKVGGSSPSSGIQLSNSARVAWLSREPFSRFANVRRAEAGTRDELDDLRELTVGVQPRVQRICRPSAPNSSGGRRPSKLQSPGVEARCGLAQGKRVDTRRPRFPLSGHETAL